MWGAYNPRFFCLQVDGLHCKNFKFWIPLIIKENKLSPIAYDAIKKNKNKAFWSKTVRSTLDQIWLGQLWIKARFMDLGIVNTIRQRFKDIELQNCMREMN